jgi:hypothetical protein
MKKLFFSAILMIAFSVTSFANTNEERTEVNAKAEPTMINMSEKEDECTTYHLRWNEVEDDGEGGMIIIYHRLDFVMCD